MTSAAFSPDGRRIITSSFDKTARLWDAETGKQIGSPLTGHTDAVSNAAFSLDGNRIITSSWDKTARLWDAETGKQIGSPLAGHTAAVSRAAFSADGRRIVTASQDKTARLWDAETGKQIGAPLTGHKDDVTSAAFSPDVRRIVTASQDKTARLWDAETGKQIGALLTGDKITVNSAVFSPDGRRIVTSSNYTSSNQTAPLYLAQLWDAETGEPIRMPLTGHRNIVLSAAFSPDSKWIVTASWDATARLWEIFANSQEFVTHAEISISRCLTREQRLAAFLDPEPPSWCIELEKWPYQTQDWKDWLKYKRKNVRPAPLPDTTE